MSGRSARCERVSAALAAVAGEDAPAFDEVPRVTTAGVVLAAVGSVIALLAPVTFAGSARSVVAGLGGALALSAAGFTWLAPAQIETFRRRSAVGAAPEVIAYAVVQARLTPSLELAARFAAEQSTGMLGRDLARNVANGPTGRESWTAFATAWRDLDDALPRAVELLAAGIESEAPARGELFDRALATVLEGSRDRVASFAADVRGPATAIYAFGVLLPLAMVGMLPVAAAAGAGVSPAAIAVLYDGVVPLGLLVASGWLAARRPAVSRPPTNADALASDRSPASTLAVAAGASVVAGSAAVLALPSWAAWIVVPGATLGAAGVYWFEPLRRRRRRVLALEAGVPDAVSLIGHRLAAGEPLETAVADVGARLAGETGALFETAGEVLRRVRVTVPEAFSGEIGALAGIESPRTETAVALLVAGARTGPEGGETLVRVASYLRDLDRMEREARRELARTTDTLRQTALVFGPAIAGVTVALATGMESIGDAGTTVPVDALGVVVGAYVLALAVVLPALSVVLERGPDVGLIGYRVSVSLLTASAVYPITAVAARTVVQV
ncbi:MAG: type II secretion system protein [Halanaeroarchaeum sp.]